MSWTMFGAIVFAYAAGYGTRAGISAIRRRRAGMEVKLKTWRPKHGPPALDI